MLIDNWLVTIDWAFLTACQKTQTTLLKSDWNLYILYNVQHTHQIIKLWTNPILGVPLLKNISVLLSTLREVTWEENLHLKLYCSNSFSPSPHPPCSNGPFMVHGIQVSSDIEGLRQLSTIINEEVSSLNKLKHKEYNYYGWIDFHGFITAQQCQLDIHHWCSSIVV